MVENISFKSSLSSRCLVLAICFSVNWATVAQAETLDPQSDNLERYQLKRDGDGFIRLDKETGAVSTCSKRGTTLVCQMAADDRDALQEELTDLQDQIAALENRLGMTDDKITKRKQQKRELQSKDKTPGLMEDELDQAMEYSSKVLKRFFAMMKDLRQELNE